MVLVDLQVPRFPGGIDHRGKARRADRICPCGGRPSQQRARRRAGERRRLPGRGCGRRRGPRRRSLLVVELADADLSIGLRPTRPASIAASVRRGPPMQQTTTSAVVTLVDDVGNLWSGRRTRRTGAAGTHGGSRYGDLHPAVVVFLAVIALAEFAINAVPGRPRDRAACPHARWPGRRRARRGRPSDRLQPARSPRHPDRRQGTVAGELIEVGFEAPGLFLGIAGVAWIRASYFTVVGIRIPTGGLIWAVVHVCAVAAVGTTIVGRNQAADEIRDRGQV